MQTGEHPCFKIQELKSKENENTEKPRGLFPNVADMSFPWGLYGVEGGVV